MSSKIAGPCAADAGASGGGPGGGGGGGGVGCRVSRHHAQEGQHQVGGGVAAGGGAAAGIAATVVSGPTVIVSVPSDDKIVHATDLVQDRRGNVASQQQQQQQEEQVLSGSTSTGPPRGAGAAVTMDVVGDLSKVADAVRKDEVGDFDGFEDLELGTDQVPLGEILDKLDTAAGEGEHDDGKGDNLIRLHAVDPGVSGDAISQSGGEMDIADALDESPTISAMIKVSTLDLSDPESIHQHLTQLNDTVLKVTTAYLPQLGSNTCSQSVANIASPSSSSCFDQVPAISVTDPAKQEAAMPQPSPGYLPAGPATVLSAPLNLPTSPVTLPTSPMPSSTAAGNTITLAMSPTALPRSNPSTPSSTESKRTTSASGKTNSQVCSICSKAFSNGSALAKHRLTHSEERRYQCTTCGKAFKRQDHLNGHLLTHRSTKPFACLAEGCGKSYCDARSLRRHKENHHGPKESADVVKKTGEQTEVKADPAQAMAAAVPVMKSTNESEIITSASTAAVDNRSNNDNHSDQAIQQQQHNQGLTVSTKGLSAQQQQLIEQLFTESKNITSAAFSKDTGAAERTGATATTTVSSPPKKKTDASLTASSMAAKALAAVQNQAFHLAPLVASPCPCGPDGEPLAPLSNAVVNLATVQESASQSSAVLALAEKPVECTMCSRKFKNIPALNGHMRLHGGYYKKDAEGKKAANGTQAGPSTAISKGGKTGSVETKPDKKVVAAKRFRSGPTTPTVPEKKRVLASDCLSNQLPAEAIRHLQNLAPGNKSCQNPLPSPSPPPTAVEPSVSFPFKSLPPPDTSQLLANLELKNLEEQQQAMQQQQQQMGGMRLHSTTMLSPHLLSSSMVHPTAPSSTMAMPGTLQIPLPPSVSKSPPPLVIRPGLHGMTTQVESKSDGIDRHHQMMPTNALPSRPPRNLMRVDCSAAKSPRIGPEYQTDIPEMLKDGAEAGTHDTSTLLWDPKTASKISAQSMHSFLTLASSCLVPGGSRNEETALMSLQVGKV